LLSIDYQIVLFVCFFFEILFFLLNLSAVEKILQTSEIITKQNKTKQNEKKF